MFFGRHILENSLMITVFPVISEHRDFLRKKWTKNKTRHVTFKRMIDVNQVFRLRQTDWLDCAKTKIKNRRKKSEQMKSYFWWGLLTRKEKRSENNRLYGAFTGFRLFFKLSELAAKFKVNVEIATIFRSTMNAFYYFGK